MKKLMLAAAVVAAGVAVAETAVPIESDIVGYVSTPISGYKMSTPCFKNFGTENYPLDKFTVQGATNGKTTCQILNAEGQSAGMYFWWNADPGDPITYPAGWFEDMGGTKPAGIELKPGEAVFFYTTESDVTIQSCGQVPGEITNDVAGYKMLGNGSPVKIAIDNFTVQGATNGKTTCQALNAEGQSAGMYFWWNADPGDPITYPAGWFEDMGGTKPAGIDLEPGDSLLFYVTEDGVTATVPSAL